MLSKDLAAAAAQILSALEQRLKLRGLIGSGERLWLPEDRAYLERLLAKIHRDASKQ
jgi:hypothetical protein